MPAIEVTDVDFARLQKFAVPLVDTPASAFTKVLNIAEGLQVAPPRKDVAPSGLTAFGPSNLPPLVHTKFLDGRFDGKSPNKASWDAMVQLALEAIYERSHDADKVRAISGANIVKGEKHDEGYKYLESMGLSYQGVSAEDAVDIIIRSARNLRVSVRIDFVWRNKDGAFKPGEPGRIEA